MSINNLACVAGYELVKKLGEGSFGKVFLAVDLNSKKKVALKCCDTSDLHCMDFGAILREVNTLRDLDHPHIVKFYKALRSPSSITMVLEYVAGANLQTILNSVRRLDETHAGHFFKQILCALQYIHDEYIVHLDLKPSNILVDTDRNVKIADFGSCSNICWGDLLFEGRTTREYASPEVLFAGCTGYDGVGADIWSIGVILYQMVTGSIPFPNAREIVNITYEIPRHVSPGCSSLISGIFQEQDKRYTLSKIRTDSWVKNIETPCD